MSTTDLLARIEAFEFNNGAPRLTFERRLARENGWTAAYNRRVLREYKRFVFLAVTAGHPVTPSEPVDQAWHLHLTFTDSYWNHFCRETLGRVLHHHPTRGGADEQAKFDDWYSRTLESYRHLIGEEPPGDIWPTPAARAAETGRSQWIDMRQNWVIPKRHVLLAVLWVALLAALLWVPGCGAGAANAVNPFSLDGPHFLVLYGVLLLLGGVAAWIVRSLPPASHSDSEALEPPLKSPYGIACLAGGTDNVITAALSSLIGRGHLHIRKYGRR
jgi:hypothetical protein